jgi:TRAP-type C4-dicarboxylate transport system permease small subunit
MDKIDAIIKKLSIALWSFGGILLLLISLSVSYDVVTRYFFSYSNEWVGEYSGYMLVCIAFLAAPYTLYIGGMTKVDLITSAVKPKAKKMLLIATLVITLVYLGILFKESSGLMMKSLTRDWRSATTIRTPLWIPQLAVPAGTVLMFLTTLLNLVKAIISKPEAPKQKLSDEELAKQLLKEAKEEGGGESAEGVSSTKEGK